MSSTTYEKPDFVPVASYVAFAFIGAVLVVGLIARCLAMSHSTIGAHNNDLVIYQAAPKPVQALRTRRPSIEDHLNSNGGTQGQHLSLDNSMAPARVQRGPKNL